MSDRARVSVDCPSCDESFKDWGSYFSHMDVIHPGSRLKLRASAESRLPSFKDMAYTWGRRR